MGMWWARGEVGLGLKKRVKIVEKTSKISPFFGFFSSDFARLTLHAHPIIVDPYAVPDRIHQVMALDSRHFQSILSIFMDFSYLFPRSILDHICILKPIVAQCGSKHPKWVCKYLSSKYLTYYETHLVGSENRTPP